MSEWIIEKTMMHLISSFCIFVMEDQV